MKKIICILFGHKIVNKMTKCAACTKTIYANALRRPRYCKNTIVKQTYYHFMCWVKLGRPALEKVDHLKSGGKKGFVYI